MTMVEIIINAAALGIGATLFMDLVAAIKTRAFKIPSLDYRLVGRWLGHMLQGQFRHTSIAAAAPMRNERLAGWGFHYLTGIIFAAALVAVAGSAWLQHPSLLPALITGVISVAAPWLIMQPAWGMGIAAANTPKPWVARQRSLVTHLTFGLGLYITGLALVKYL